jgi:4-aminobutyrate aminotransferase
MEPVIKAALERMKERLPCVADVRGRGFMWGIELVNDAGKPDPALTTKVIVAAFDHHNLIIRGTRYGYGNVIEFRPALVAQEDELREMISRIEKGITDVAPRNTPPARPRAQQGQPASSFEGPR